jgi:GrpB-like predicted nucleotidyltransferase (UPF0157 family)
MDRRDTAEPLCFVLSDLVVDETSRAFAEHERRIRELLPDAEVGHRGGSSLAGVLTMGDVDVHVRTPRPSFELAREALCDLYEPLHSDVWHSEWAAYFAPGSQPRVEVALTAIGSPDDFHHGEAWDWIAADATLVERYNALKRAHEGGEPDAYNAAKRAFFYDLRDDQDR